MMRSQIQDPLVTSRSSHRRNRSHPWIHFTDVFCFLRIFKLSGIEHRQLLLVRVSQFHVMACCSSHMLSLISDVMLVLVAMVSVCM